MSTAAEYTSSGFNMGFLESFTIERPVMKTDPYNPDALIETNKITSFEIKAYLATGSSSQNISQPRMLTISNAQLIIPNPDTDLRLGDMVVKNKRRWRVIGFPAMDMNPFTGWKPTLVVDLQEVQG